MSLPLPQRHTRGLRPRDRTEKAGATSAMNPSAKPSAKPPSDDRKRRAGGLRAIATALPQVTGKALGKLKPAEAALLADWAAIVGAEVAAWARPRRLRFPRKEERREGTLVLVVDPAFALDLQHRQDQLLNRINGFFGYRAVARLRMEQGALPAPRQDATEQPPRALAPVRAARLAAQVEAIEDEALRQALLRLGRAIAARQQARTPKPR